MVVDTNVSDDTKNIDRLWKLQPLIDRVHDGCLKQTRPPAKPDTQSLLLLTDQLKAAYYYLLKKFAKVVKASFLVKDDDEKAAEIDKFLEVLALNQHIVFGNATYVLNKNRQSRLRRPESLPSEEDVAKLKACTVNRIQKLTADDYKIWDTHSFTELRDLAVSRLIRCLHEAIGRATDRRSRDRSPRRLHRVNRHAIVAAIGRATDRRDRSRDRSPRRSLVCLHGAIAATIASCKHRITGVSQSDVSQTVGHA